MRAWVGTLERAKTACPTAKSAGGPVGFQGGVRGVRKRSSASPCRLNTWGKQFVSAPAPGNDAANGYKLRARISSQQPERWDAPRNEARPVPGAPGW